MQTTNLLKEIKKKYPIAMKNYTPEQRDKRVAHFRRIIKFRSWFGWVFAVVGFSLLGVGATIQNQHAILVILNGTMFFGYGLFMVRQARKAFQKLDRSEA